MTPEEIQKIKNLLGELSLAADVYTDKSVSPEKREEAERQAVKILTTIHVNSVMWLGQLIKMVENDDELHN